MLLRNDQATHAAWIRLQLVGTRSNRDGAGARITVRVGDHTRVREVTASRSYLSASELPVTIGLGSAARPDSVQITWPGGAVQSVPNVEPGRLTVVKQTPP